MLQKSQNQRELEDGWLRLEGNPGDVLPGDRVMDQRYAVLMAKPAEHNREPGTQLTLAKTEDYADWLTGRPGDPLPKEAGRVVLGQNHKLVIVRQVADIDFGEEDLFPDLEFCKHEEHDDYNFEWYGPCRDVPRGLLVGVNLSEDSIDPACKVVDSVYPSGAVIFTDGTVFQSHPDKKWYGYVNNKELRRGRID